MSNRNHPGSTWQRGCTLFGVGGYNQNCGYNGQYNVSHQMMIAGYDHNQDSCGGAGGIYCENGMSQMRNTGYRGPSSPMIYKHDRIIDRQKGPSGVQRKCLPQRDHSSVSTPKITNVENSTQMDRNQIQRKRVLQRSPGSGPLSKKAKLDSDRRVAKPRKCGRSRDGFKSNDMHKDIDNAHKPKEPTDDLSYLDYDMFECWKSFDDAVGKEKNDEKETTETQVAEKVSKTEESKLKKPFVCYVCKVSYSKKKKLTKHQKSKSHKSKIDGLLSIGRQKEKEGGEEVKESREQNKKESSRKPGNWCTICECTFTGNYLVHCRSKEHRTKREKKYVKCRPCRLDFSNSEEYRDHCKSEKHKQASAEFYCLKNLASGSDEDEAAIQPAKRTKEAKSVEEKEVYVEKTEVVEEEENTVSSKDNQQNDGSNTKDIKGKNEKHEKKEADKSKPKEVKYVGQSLVVPVQGHYCKLCHKFFKDVTVAKIKHCQSVMHTDAFKKAMEEAIEEEEERQKLDEEQDEIDAIERDAKEAVIKELAAKKAGTSMEEDVEMKDVSGENSSFDKKGSRNEVNISNYFKEEMHDAYSEANKEEKVNRESGETFRDVATIKDGKEDSKNEESTEKDFKRNYERSS